MIGADYSSKFSPWLANGSISVKQIYHAVKLYESQNNLSKQQSESLNHFISELYWRDFFRFYCVNWENAIFYAEGIKNSAPKWKNDPKIVQRWKTGTTGFPIIDANMRELNATGFMSNRGRQIVGSFLALDLQQDWRYGASHFEEMLIDHDVHSNYGGWNAIAGVGPGRVNFFNTVGQSQRYDPEGEYIKLWVPELKDVPANFIHDPWNMPKGLQKMLKLTIGESGNGKYDTLYPSPIPVHKYTSAQAAKKNRDEN